VKVALRTDAAGGAAFFDTSTATLFQRRPFRVPVQFSDSGPPFTPVAAASGSAASDTLGRTLAWSLELSQPVLETNVLSALVTLRFSGLSATGREVVAQGILVANRIDAAP
jgi:hypothetical protein